MLLSPVNRIAGPTLDNIEIQAFADTSGRIASGDIRYVYYVSESILVPTPTPTPVTHIWAKSGGECSVTCGFGNYPYFVIIEMKIALQISVGMILLVNGHKPPNFGGRKNWY